MSRVNSVAVLNPQLYDRLVSRFGDVYISGVGQRATISRSRSGNRWRISVHGGEYYRVSCPACRGYRKLWISYLLGQKDPETGQTINHAAVCFKCNRTPDRLDLGGLFDIRIGRVADADVTPTPALAIVDAVQPHDLAAIQLPPGEYVRVDRLAASHPAREFLVRRGVDVDEVGTLLSWMLCNTSSDPKMVLRLVIPVAHEIEGALCVVGFQTRMIPGLSLAQEPKYYTMDGFKKSRVLYNLYNASRTRRVVVTEGPMDVAAVGLQAVCVFGHSLSSYQVRLLMDHCSDAQIAIMFDSDAHISSLDTARKLSAGGLAGPIFAGGVFPVLLERGDPSDYTRRQLMEMIERGYDDFVCGRRPSPVGPGS